MQVDVSQVKRSPGRREQLELTVEPAQGLHWQGEELPFARPLIVKLTLESGKGGVIFAQGEVRTAIKTVCSRCLQPVEHPVTTEFSGEFYVQGKAPVDQEEEFPGQFYSGDTLQLDGLVRESIYLSLPMQFLCSPECRGLCPFCGARADDGCHCAEEQVDPRLEVLKQLFKDSK